MARFVGLGAHRYLSLLAVGFLAVHILAALAGPFGGVGLGRVGLGAVVVPFVTGCQRAWLGLGTIASDLLAAVVVTSLLRRRIGRRWWRAVHWLAYVCWPAALAHSVGTGPGMRSGRLLGAAIACVVAVAIAACWRLRLHLVCTLQGLPVAFALAGAKADDREVTGWHARRRPGPGRHPARPDPDRCQELLRP